MAPYLRCWSSEGPCTVQTGHSSAAARKVLVHRRGATKVAVMMHSMMTDGRSNRSPACHLQLYQPCCRILEHAAGSPCTSLSTAKICLAGSVHDTLKLCCSCNAPHPHD